jgi:two-component system OmpR family response regulator
VGADDYLTKPFDQRELLARVKAVLRRTPMAASRSSETRPQLRFGDWCLDVTRRELRSSRDRLVQLSGREFDLLLAFAEHPQRILTRERLRELALGAREMTLDRRIDVLVSRLRDKLEEVREAPALIRTVRNGGYIFVPEVERG